MSDVLSCLRGIVAFLLGRLLILWENIVRAPLAVEQAQDRDFADRIPVRAHAGLVHRPVQEWVAP